MELPDWYIIGIIGLVLFCIIAYLFERSNISDRIKKIVGAIAMVIVGLVLLYTNIYSLTHGGVIVIGLVGLCLVGGIFLILEEIGLI